MRAESVATRRILFVKHALAYPRASGHDIRCFEMLRAFHALGHHVALATVEPPDDHTRAQLGVPCFSLTDPPAPGSAVVAPLSYWQERFRSYWGVHNTTIQAVARVAGQFEADVVVGLGLDVLPFLAGAGDRVKVWYAADEWMVHHLSQFRMFRARTYGELRAAVVKGLYERAYAPLLDRAWVVSPTEQRAMSRFAGVKHVDVIPNGVDTEYFAPIDTAAVDSSAVFWGRLDFGPNLQALEWFCDRVWPNVRQRVPSATLTIIGFNAGSEVRARAGRDGIQLITDVPDIRPFVAAHQVVVLPMISGGGIKNKLLEAAALGKAIVCTTKACSGLRGTPPAVILDDERAWVDALIKVWQSDDERRGLERSARAWILEHHTWEAAARDALRGLDGSLTRWSSLPAELPAQSPVQADRPQPGPEPRLLFVKRSLAFPRASGDDVCCFELLRALRRSGCSAALATIERPDQQTLDQLDVPWYSLTAASSANHERSMRLTYWQDRFRSYWGLPTETIRSVAVASRQFDATVVVGVGLEALPFLAAAGERIKIWYAADEWVLHHLSQLRLLQPATYSELRSAIVKGFYERTYAALIDRAWVVSTTEKRAMRRLAGVRHVDVVANGVDPEYFAPSKEITPAPNSAVFWGRLDFGPNLQALEWFCSRVWPALQQQVPTARLTIMGFNAGSEVRALARRPGIELKPDVPDIRAIAAASALVVLPMISGGGIKNKLLEAAALGKAIVCTTKACSGLRTTLPAAIVDDERGWVDAVLRLWRTPNERQRLERSARSWVLTHHSWEAAARDALRELDGRNG